LADEKQREAQFTFGRLSERRMQARRASVEAAQNSMGTKTGSGVEIRRRRDDIPNDATTL
jgi:hypothetical protein